MKTSKILIGMNKLFRTKESWSGPLFAADEYGNKCEVADASKFTIFSAFQRVCLDNKEIDPGLNTRWLDVSDFIRKAANTKERFITMWDCSIPFKDVKKALIAAISLAKAKEFQLQ